MLFHIYHKLNIVTERIRCQMQFLCLNGNIVNMSCTIGRNSEISINQAEIIFYIELENSFNSTNFITTIKKISPRFETSNLLIIIQT